MAAAELEFAVDAEGVIPDHPTATVQVQVALEDHLEFCREVVADGQPERAVRFERPHQRRSPLPRPIQVFAGGELVLVDVVRVSDVERRIGERQVHRPLGDLAHPRDAILIVKSIGFHTLHNAPFE